MSFNILLGIAFLTLFSFAAVAQNAKSRTEPLTIGMTAPDFTLNDQNGKPVTLSKIRKPAVLVFYRGYW